MGNGLWSYLTNFVMRLKLEREKPSSPMYLPLSKLSLSLYELYIECQLTLRCKPIYKKTLS